MSKRIILLDLLLLVVCIYLGRQVYLDFQEFNDTHKVISIEAESAEKKGEKAGGSISSSRTPVNPAEFMLISERNLFLESRSLQAASAAPAVDLAPQLNPKPVLMGIATVGSEPRAFIQTMRAQPGQKPNRVLKLGDVYEGYKVSQIQKNRVELSFTSAAGNVTTQVLDINDPATRPSRVAVKTQLPPSQVITVGGQGGSVAAIPGSPPGGANQTIVDEQGRRIVRTPFGDVVQGAAGAGRLGGAAPPQGNAAAELARQGQQQLLQEQQLLQQQKQQPLRRNEIIDDQGRRVIRTPFGDIVRPPEAATPPPQPPPEL